ncbi:pirin family protein [Undibacterium sp. CY18W]|uniref:Pirin family protein n=1 Tax=Undibacterium hunanense TaxID=2762292 RepID=A0ABR6ZMC7_9BURK|nr:pirin family protein [Undibacterium hunanense]MBC3917037.1 pirin family protein [Undibacterium hunanense]
METTDVVASNTAVQQAENVTHSRVVEQLVAGQPTSDGAGVKLTRVLTQPLQYRLDPFLMLDAFGSDEAGDYIAGFPSHPHRGFETITYMLAGRMRHRDSAGNEGLLQNGGVQWMTAGRGVIHSEMPEQEEGRMAGFQLWLNLPAKDKMIAPWYRDIQSGTIPELLTAAGVKVRIIAGSSHGVAGAVQREVTQPLYLDIHMPAGSSFSHNLPASFNAFVYVYEGEVQIAERDVPVQRMAILKKSPDADGVVIDAKVDSRFLLIAGQPLGETIVQYGPFVMNSQAEIFKAISDFREGKLAEVV